MPACSSSLSALVRSPGAGFTACAAVGGRVDPAGGGAQDGSGSTSSPGSSSRSAVGAAAGGAGGDGRRRLVGGDRAVGGNSAAGAGRVRGTSVGVDVSPGAGRRRYHRGGGRVDQVGDRPPGPLLSAATGGHARR